MHYPGNAFSNNTEPTIIDRSTNKEVLLNEELSEIDLRKLNDFYPCRTQNGPLPDEMPIEESMVLPTEEPTEKPTEEEYDPDWTEEYEYESEYSDEPAIISYVDQTCNTDLTDLMWKFVDQKWSAQQNGFHFDLYTSSFLRHHAYGSPWTPDKLFDNDLTKGWHTGNFSIVFYILFKIQLLKTAPGLKVAR